MIKMIISNKDPFISYFKTKLSCYHYHHHHYLNHHHRQKIPESYHFLTCLSYFTCHCINMVTYTDTCIKQSSFWTLLVKCLSYLVTLEELVTWIRILVQSSVTTLAECWAWRQLGIYVGERKKLHLHHLFWLVTEEYNDRYLLFVNPWEICWMMSKVKMMKTFMMKWIELLYCTDLTTRTNNILK